MTTTQKTNLGQFFTVSTNWLYPQVIRFIKNRKILDPYAGDGNIFQSLVSIGINDFRGMDIDKSKLWNVNDSLKNIPKTDRMIITNPPYLAKNSANRKNLGTYKYFKGNTYSDIYQIALERMLESHNDIVAIVPETFINHPICEGRLKCITVVEDELFNDTDCPVCVVCYTEKHTQSTKIYKGDKYCCTLKQLKKHTKTPTNDINIKFNIKSGNIGLRAIDGTGDNDICFCDPSDLDYPVDKIGTSSRAITIIKVDNGDIIDECNRILKEYRNDTYDMLLSPFKGNKKNGTRRRRLDFKTARAIIEEATRNV